MRARLDGADGASEDAATLAARATDLAACASYLRGGGREVEEVAARIRKALKAFSEAASSIAARLSNAPVPHGGAAA